MRRDTVASSLSSSLRLLPPSALREKAALAHRRGWRSVLADIRGEFRRRRGRARGVLAPCAAPELVAA